LIAYTITYNLGIRIDRYAKVNFSGFKQVVDALEGIDVAVDCPLTDYRIKSPNLNPNIEANYAWWTLPIGYHHMDGSLALWYARSRYTTSDFDRSRRQQTVLRAIWRKAKTRDFTSTLPKLWEQVTKIVETNMTLVDAASLLPLAIEVDPSRVHSYFLGPGQVKHWSTPEGASVLVPQTQPIRDLIKLFYTPPTTNRLFAEQPTLEILNGTANKAWDKIAASRLSWEGFIPTEAGNADKAYDRTLIYDFTGNAKPSSLRTLRAVLGVGVKDVIDQPDPERKVDFKVVLGRSYKACTYSPWKTAN
jgi:LCP family protein required for cell wall assembly